MQVETSRAVKADVLDRYYRILCRYIDKVRKEQTAKSNPEGYRNYLKAKTIKKDIKGRVEYNKMYLAIGKNPTVFIER